MITREITTELTECAREYPAVTILGPRQSGKTTLARMAFPGHSYISLEDPDTRAHAESDPRGLLASCGENVIIDEIQRQPDLLSYLQGMIDSNRTPGRFILTGSHQPLLHQAVSQSLAGRTAVLELYPFSISEARLYKRESGSVYERMLLGFYPGLHENMLKPERFFRSYMATYIERDLRTLTQIKDLSQFNTFLRLLAGRVGQLVNYTSLANDVGVSSTTIKSWVSILKASYILYELPPWFANVRKRLVKSPKLYFVDVGLAAWLLGIETAEQLERDPLRGNLYENLLIMDAVKTLLNKGKRPQFYFFRDSHGSEVDLVSTTNARDFHAVEIKSASTFQPGFIKGIDVFEQTVPAGAVVTREVWYGGDAKLCYNQTDILNPLIHKRSGL